MNIGRVGDMFFAGESFAILNGVVMKAFLY